MMGLRYCTSDSLESLRHAVPDRLDWYYSPDTEPTPQFGTFGFRESKLKAPRLADGLVTDADSPSITDVENALNVYEALSELTPHQASIERLWVYLCHFDCPQYVAARWLKQRPERKKMQCAGFATISSRPATGA